MKCVPGQGKRESGSERWEVMCLLADLTRCGVMCGWVWDVHPGTQGQQPCWEEVPGESLYIRAFSGLSRAERAASVLLLTQSSCSWAALGNLGGLGRGRKIAKRKM